jgi:hypothetical protein
MAQVLANSAAADCVMAALVSGLQVEFGTSAGTALVARFLKAEDIDFYWDARVQERWIGSCCGDEDAEIELDRVRILGRIDGRWFVAMMLVDGDGNAHGMLGKRSCGRAKPANAAFADA